MVDSDPQVPGSGRNWWVAVAAVVVLASMYVAGAATAIGLGMGWALAAMPAGVVALGLVMVGGNPSPQARARWRRAREARRVLMVAPLAAPVLVMLWVGSGDPLMYGLAAMIWTGMLAIVCYPILDQFLRSGPGAGETPSEESRSTTESLWDSVVAGLTAANPEQRAAAVMTTKFLMDHCEQDRQRAWALLALFVRVYKDLAYYQHPPIDLRIAACLLDTGELPTEDQMRDWTMYSDTITESDPSDIHEPTIVVDEAQFGETRALHDDGVTRLFLMRVEGHLNGGDGSTHIWRIAVPPDIVEQFTTGLAREVRTRFPR